MRSEIAVRLIRLGIAAMVTSAALVACGGDEETTAEAGAGANLPQGSEPVKLDPAEFTTEIDNPYWPMKPGSPGSTESSTARGPSRRSSSR